MNWSLGIVILLDTVGWSESEFSVLSIHLWEYTIDEVLETGECRRTSVLHLILGRQRKGDDVVVCPRCRDRPNRL
jgi:hypothetical protein